MKKNNTDPIEQLLSDTFKDYTIPEFKNSWVKIKTKVFKHQFLKFNLYQFNVYYSAVVAGSMITAGTVLINPSVPEKTTDNPPEVKTEIPNLAEEDSSLLEQVNQEEIHYDNLQNRPASAIDEDENIDAAPVINTGREVNANIDSAASEKLNETTGDEIAPEKGIKDSPVLQLTEEREDTGKDSARVKKSEPAISNTSPLVEASQTDSLIQDTTIQKKTVKKVIVVEKPVVKRDTIVKVIRKRRRK